MWPFRRRLAMSRDALVDLKSGEAADKYPVWTELRHGLHQRVVGCKGRTAEARPQAGERMGVCGTHTDIDLFSAKSHVEQHGGAILWAQRVVIRAALGQHGTAVHRGTGSGQTERQHMAPA